MHNFSIKKQYWDRSLYAIISIDSESKGQLQQLKQDFEIFFSLSMEKKMKYWLGDSPIPFRGYFPPFKQNYDSRGKYKDFKEGYDMGFDLLSQKGRTKDYRHFFGPNIFPKEIPEIKENISYCLSFFKELSRVVRKCIFEDLSNKKNNMLSSEKFFNRSVDTLRFLNYNSNNNSKKHVFTTPLVKHSDPGLLTFIYTDQPGLEFYNYNKKKWEKALANENQLIIVWGKFLELVTESKYKASLHRIKKLSKNKTSLCFFHNPNYDACLEKSPDNIIESGRQIFCCGIGYNGDAEKLYKDQINKIW